MSLKLGEGIARVGEVRKPVEYCQKVYVINDEFKGPLKFLGMALDRDENRAISGGLEPECLTIRFGEVWKGDGVSGKKIFSEREFNEVKDLIEENKDGLGLYGQENLDTGKEIIIREIKDKNSPSKYQIWMAKNPDNFQALIDSIYCLHFDETAMNRNGEVMSPDEILKIAEPLGDTFEISHQGEMILPTVK